MSVYCVVDYDAVVVRVQEGEFGRIAEEGRYRDDPDNVLNGHKPMKPTDSGFDSGVQSPVSISSASSTSSEEEREPLIPVSPATGNNITNDPSNMTHRQSNGTLESRSRSTGHITTFPNFSTTSSQRELSLWWLFAYKLKLPLM